MLDDFFTRALLAGIGVAILAGPLGCFIIWRRMAYFGDTLAHSALLGVALGLLFSFNLTFAVFIVATVLALLLFTLERMAALSADSLLGILSHSALAIGLVALSLMPWVRMDLTGLLFGDILAVSRLDLMVIYGGGVLVLVGLAYIWRGLFASTLSPEIAAAEGLHPDRVSIIFMLLLALVIAIAMKVVGVLLITALLIIPAATARRFAWSPEVMLVIAALLGVVSVIGGLYSSLYWDTPSGPSIVVAATCLFAISLLPGVGRLTRTTSSLGKR